VATLYSSIYSELIIRPEDVVQPGRAAVRALSGVAAAVFGLLVVAAPSRAQAEDLLVFAAASLKDALDAALADYQAAGGAPAKVSCASSSTLARQIEGGAPADIFISANPEWMDYLEERDLIRGGSRADLLGNELVLVAPRDEDTRLEIAPGFDLLGALGGGRLAMGDPDHVPAGIYGKAALESLGVWQEVEPHVIRADNVRAALVLVARGEAPLGVVYRSDAAADDTVRVVGAFPPDSHAPIIYPLAIMAESKHPAAAGLVEFLRSEGALPLFERFGFTVLE
jgi:molybdate transport system substrate-binding protein